MSFFTHSSIYVGIEKTSNGLRMATLIKRSKGWEIAYLREITWEDIVNPLDKLPSDAIISCALSSRDVLVRTLELPLKKEKDIVAALPFQVEPLLPYPIEKCILQKSTLEVTSTGTLLTLFSTKKEALNQHLSQWKSLSIDPDVITCGATGLAAVSTFAQLEEPILALHLGMEEGTCALIEKGKVYTARPVKKDVQDIQKTILAITTSFKSKKVDHLLFLGEDLPFAEKIQDSAEKKLLFLKIPSISEENVQKFGFAIGIAMAGGEDGGCNFRHHDSSIAHQWKKIKKPFVTFCAAAIFLFTATLGLTQFLLHKEEKAIQKEYLSLLALQGKKEQASLSQKEILISLSQMEKDIQGKPNTFPLHPVIPKVSDVLAWLSSHPAFSHLEEGVGIENFHYVLEKRPDFSHRNERYQVKVEFEISCTNPEAARAFHESLLAPNPFVDAKKEVQWTPGKNKYLASFYLKDKTRYHS